MTHRFFWKLWLEMRLGATVATRKQNKHQANGILLILQRQWRPDMFSSCWLVYLVLLELCTRNLFLPDKLWINNFVRRCSKYYALVYGKNDQKCGVAAIGSVTTTMPLLTWPCVCSSLWQKHVGYPWSSLFTWLALCDFFMFPRMKGQMKGKRFAGVREVKKKMLEVLNNISMEEFQKCFQQWEKMLVQVYWV